MVDVDTFLTILYVMADDFCKTSLPPEPHPGPQAAPGQAHLAIERVFRYSARVTLPSEAPCIARRTPHGYACALIVS
jgi:hypothetical protein